MKNILSLFAITFMTFGCSTPAKKISSHEIAKDFIFPYGIYKHDIQFQVLGHESADRRETVAPQNYHFKGVIKLGPDLIQVVALSPFGTTVFKITDDLKKNQVTDEIYVDRVKPFEPKLLKYYGNLKTLLTTRRETLAPDQTLAVDSETTIQFGKKDDNQIPETVKIMSRAYTVDIEVTGYEL
jgi:hypothetical protein